MHLNNIETEKQFGLRHGFDVCTVARYLGGFIGDDESKHDWLQDQKTTWENKIHTISETARNTSKKVTPWWYERYNWSGYSCNV